MGRGFLGPAFWRVAPRIKAGKHLMTNLSAVELQLIGSLLRGDEAGSILHTPAQREWLDQHLSDLFAMDPNPALRNLSEGILDAALAGEGGDCTRMPVHFPCWNERQWRDRASLLPILTVEPKRSGRIVIGPEPNVAIPVLSWARHGEGARTEGVELFTEDRRRIEPRCLGITLPALLKRYGLAGGVMQAIREEREPVELTFSFSLAAEHAAVWRHPPGERDEGYTATYRRVSGALQRTLRAWIPYLYFVDVDRFDFPEECYSVLVYRGTQPFPGRNKSQFTYDVLDPSTQRGAFYVSARSFPAVLEKIRDLLRGAGRQEQSMAYLPGRAEAIFGHVRRHHKRLDALFMADTNVFNRFHRLGLDVNAARSTRDLWNAASGFHRQLQNHLRHLYCGNAWPEIAGLLMLEATAALARVPLEAELRMRLGKGQEVTFRCV